MRYVFFCPNNVLIKFREMELESQRSILPSIFEQVAVRAVPRKNLEKSPDLMKIIRLEAALEVRKPLLRQLALCFIQAVDMAI